MTNDSIKNLLERHDLLCRQLGPLSAKLKGLEEGASRRWLVDEINHQQEAWRAALGPLADLGRASLLNPTSQLTSASEQLGRITAQIEARFRLPDIAEATRLLQQFEDSVATSVARRMHEIAADVQHALEGMRAPWLDIQNSLRSIGGLVELQSIGHALRTMPAFDAHLADVIRIDLGDWRDKITWPPEIFANALARTSFYTARGLDPALTAFPAVAFAQSIDYAGLKGAPPPLAPTYYAAPKVEATDEEDVGFERTNAAHDRLQRFESQLRKFIDETMKAVFGEDWIKHRVPGEIRKAWMEKRQTARDSGESERPLIAYADFSDYVPIIVRNDNWEQAFERIFRRKSFVQESFQRLYPIRICTMHARLITQDDELYLYVETKRILATIGIAT